MGAYHNALREEGTREELIAALEQSWAENERLRGVLHSISLGSQNSMASKKALGKEARAALNEKDASHDD